MKDKMFIIGKLIGLAIFVLAFSMIGLASGRPVMILAYAGFFVLVMFFIFMFVKKRQRHFEVISEKNRNIQKAIGALLILAAIAIPALSIANMQLFDLGVEKISFGLMAVIVILTILLIAAAAFAVTLINRASSNKMKKLIGYVIVIVVSAIPALLVIPNDRTTTGIGSVYYLAILVAVLSWSGFNLVLNKE